MLKEEIQDLAKKYHKPGSHIKKEWHPVYIKECEKNLYPWTTGKWAKTDLSNLREKFQYCGMNKKLKKQDDIKSQKVIIKDTLKSLWQTVQSGRKPDQDFWAGLKCLNAYFMNPEKLYSKRQYKSYMDLIFYIAECERFYVPSRIRQNDRVTYNQWLYSRMFCL